MIREGHLEVYDLILTTCAPLHVGSGQEYTKKEYVYNSQTHVVSIIDSGKLFNLIFRNGMMTDYEYFILSQPYDTLYSFLKDHSITLDDIRDITLYTVDASDALIPGQTLAGIRQFIRNSRFYPYIPGSSLKGALRTALLHTMIKSRASHTPNDKGKTADIEAEFLNTLRLYDRRPSDAINSVMRGISVSDSEPIPMDAVILTRKDDVNTSGVAKSINTIREAIRPDVTIRFKLTIDTSVHSGITAETLRKAVSAFGAYYYNAYAKRFTMPVNSVNERFADCLLLGGGSGYFSKNIAYALYGEEAGLRYVTGEMNRRFRAHYHNTDVERGISPHCMKHTTYLKKSYHYGVCRFSLE